MVDANIGTGLLHRTPTDVAFLFEILKATPLSSRNFNAIYFCKRETVFAKRNPKPGTCLTGF